MERCICVVRSQTASASASVFARKRQVPLRCSLANGKIHSKADFDTPGIFDPGTQEKNASDPKSAANEFFPDRTLMANVLELIATWKVVPLIIACAATCSSYTLDVTTAVVHSPPAGSESDSEFGASTSFHKAGSLYG